MITNFESMGSWWASSDIEVVRLENELYVLDGWNGERFLHCNKCIDNYNLDESDKKEYVIEPIYKQVGDEEDEEFELVGYEIH